MDLFAQAPNKTVLHSEDWNRLYDFTIHVHLRHLPISSWNVVTYLLAHDFSHEAASRLSGEFARFLELLNRYDTQKTSCSLQKASWLSAQYQHFTELLALYDHQKTS